tara:strand:+ start:107 stop:1156 length:1050 start_codon:yes stop_codon:yes gene_type:complete
MKKKSLSAKKIIHKKLIKNLKNNRINKVFKIFKNNLGFIKTNNIAVAVSGGPDSLALSYLVKCLVINNKKKAFFYLVDHKIRKNSSIESKSIRRLLKNYDIKCKILTWKGKKPKSNLQSVARNKRYSLIYEQCIKDNVKYLITGHHIDDLYENFFLRILRGSGLDGFVSFNSIKNKLKNDIYILRPLINIQKEDLIYISKKIFGFYLEDPSNKKDEFKRSRLRKIINNLKKEGLDHQKLNLTINNLSSSNKAINYYVNKNISENSKILKKSTYILSQKFLDNPTDVLIRSFSKVLKLVGENYYPPRGKSLIYLINLIKSKNFNKMTLSGCVIEKISKSLLIYKEKRQKT